ncbi:MAG: hypothetical protein N2746_06770, partial [Deltaproteobacteria bacterium]|nr:hypothetical protein [Deltaproteobacteria bacterium]
GIRTCKNTAQCRSDEECVNGVCVKRSPRDVGMDEVVEIPMDVGLDIGEDSYANDIYDVGEGVYDARDIEIGYSIGIMSVYEGSAGECWNEGYVLRSVSGYSGVKEMGDGEYTVKSGARFK